METDACDLLFQCTSLMSNAFTINSAEQSPTSRHAEQRARSVQRRLNIAPLHMEFEAVGDECATTPEKEDDEASFYPGNSPRRSPGPCPISPCDDETLLSLETSPVSNRFSLVQTIYETSSSMDSGYHAAEKTQGFQFAAPSGVAPRKTPRKSPKTNSIRIFHSLSSGSVGSAADADEYMDLFDMEDDDEDTHMPTDLSSLLSGDIKAVRNTPERPMPIARRSLSMNESNIINRARNLFDAKKVTPEKPSTPRQALTPIRSSMTQNTTPYSSKVCFKRPEPPATCSPASKRYKYDNEHQENIAPLVSSPISSSAAVIKAPAPSRPLFKKSISMNDANIMSALARSNSEPNLIGDFSKPFVLPLMEGRHSDLKSISADTMAKLVRGEFDSQVASFKVIDCRYPYEFEGGHIRGAQNLYMQEQIMKVLMDSSAPSAATISDAPKRNILVFHCEFSSERGPKLSRFLRNNDRLRNQDSYPALQYPEIYLLHGGYKDFFAAYPELCDPIAYRPMLEPEFTDEYKHFRAKTRSWSGDGVTKTAVKGTLAKSRSRLVL
ncbi:M-phase inducer phosphatase-like isoform X2 [Culicoides brevitarsis]|uniref:M-phase inducer phosphatase-like isoform X2 n=1 Tax=Culicoides brevitarsis TaxID=469753 RepID=UPI00307C70F6